MFTNDQHRSWRTLSFHAEKLPGEGHVLNILGLVAQVVTVGMTQFCLSSAKAAIQKGMNMAGFPYNLIHGY